MTEQEWLTETSPSRLIDFLHATARKQKTGPRTDRKLRLFVAGCFRRMWPQLRDERSRDAVALWEACADGRLTLDELRARTRALPPGGLRRVEPIKEAVRQAIGLAEGAAINRAERLEGGVLPREWAALAAVVRDLFGNPFRPVAVEPSRQARSVLRLAQAAYDERELPSGYLDPARLAVLADALEEAGCTDTELLGHLRSPGPHVRGCWSVDLLLGKA